MSYTRYFETRIATFVPNADGELALSGLFHEGLDIPLHQCAGYTDNTSPIVMDALALLVQQHEYYRCTSESPPFYIEGPHRQQRFIRTTPFGSPTSRFVNLKYFDPQKLPRHLEDARSFLSPPALAFLNLTPRRD